MPVTAFLQEHARVESLIPTSTQTRERMLEAVRSTGMPRPRPRDFSRQVHRRVRSRYWQQVQVPTQQGRSLPVAGRVGLVQLTFQSAYCILPTSVRTHSHRDRRHS